MFCFQPPGFGIFVVLQEITNVTQNTIIQFKCCCRSKMIGSEGTGSTFLLLSNMFAYLKDGRMETVNHSQLPIVALAEAGRSMEPRTQVFQAGNRHPTS